MTQYNRKSFVPGIKSDKGIHCFLLQPRQRLVSYVSLINVQVHVLTDLRNWVHTVQRKDHLKQLHRRVLVNKFSQICLNPLRFFSPLITLPTPGDLFQSNGGDSYFYIIDKQYPNSMDCILESLLDTVTSMIVDIVGVLAHHSVEDQTWQKITVNKLRFPPPSSPLVGQIIIH